MEVTLEDLRRDVVRAVYAEGLICKECWLNLDGHCTLLERTEFDPTQCLGFAEPEPCPP